MHDQLANGFAPGMLIENNIPDSKADRLSRLRDRGYRIADLCEESIIYPNPEDYWAQKNRATFAGSHRRHLRDGRQQRARHPRASTGGGQEAGRHREPPFRYADAARAPRV